jgi:hypothetical protein
MTRLWVGRPRNGVSILGIDKRSFYSIQRPDRFGADAVTYSVGLGALFPGVKRPDSEADHPLLSSTEVKNARSYASTLPIHLYGIGLNSAHEQLYLLSLCKEKHKIKHIVLSFR